MDVVEPAGLDTEHHRHGNESDSQKSQGDSLLVRDDLIGDSWIRFSTVQENVDHSCNN